MRKKIELQTIYNMKKYNIIPHTMATTTINTDIQTVLTEQLKGLLASNAEATSTPPSFIVSQMHSIAIDNTTNCQLEKCFSEILDGRDINAVIFNSLLLSGIYKNIFDVYCSYNNCVSKKLTDIAHEITKAFVEHTDENILYKCMEQHLSEIIDNMSTICGLLCECDAVCGRKNNRYNNSKKISAIGLAMFLHSGVDGSPIMSMLDKVITDDAHNLTIIGQIIQTIAPLGIKVVNDSLVSYMKNIKILFLKNIHRLPVEVSSPMLHFMSSSDNFIKTYGLYLSERLPKHNCVDTLLIEIRLLKTLIPQDELDKKCIDRMVEQIDNISNSISLSTIFAKKTNLIVASEKYKNIPINTGICNFNVIDKYVWDVSLPTQMTLPIEIEIYQNIFNKLYEIDNKHSELVLDSRKSTGIIEFEISDNIYEFLVTFQQMNVLIQILKNKSQTVEQLQIATAIPEDELQAVLNGMYTFEILNFEDNSYSINHAFSCTQTQISLLNTLDYAEKFDEEIVLNIVDIIDKSDKHSIDEIFNEYVAIYGVTNFGVIDSTVKYLENKNILTFNKIYSISANLFAEIEECAE